MSEVQSQLPVSADLEEDLPTLLARGEHVLHGEGDLRSSRRLFRMAYRAAEREGDAAAMARAALGLGGLRVHEHRTVATAVEVQACQRQALSIVDPRSSLRLRLRARLAAEADYRVGGSASVLAVLEEARSAGDPVARAEALSLALHCVLGPDHAALRRPLADELLAEGVLTGRGSDLLMGLLWQTVDLFLAADSHSEGSLGQLREMLAHRNHLAVGHFVSAIEVMLAIRAGRFEQAKKMATVCAELGEAAGDGDSAGWYVGQLIAIRWFQGRLAELLPMLGELVNSSTLRAVNDAHRAALAVAAAIAGDRRMAAGALARLCASDLAGVPRTSSWLATMYGIVEAAHLLGDADLSARAYTLLIPYARLPVMAGPGVVCFGSVQHSLGMASLTTGATERAVEHFHAAVRDNLALGHWPAVVLSRAWLVRALMSSGRASDVAAARRERATVAREAGELGMPMLESARPDAVDLVACDRRGRLWQVTWGSRSALIEHSVGMRHLAMLLANPGREISAAELAAGPEQPALATVVGSDQPVLDEKARRQYRQRLAQLAAEIDEFESNNDFERAARSRQERDWLLSELDAAIGMAGRSRPFATSEERARIAVGKAIRRALHRIAEADSVIGAELKATVSTGRRCSYQPDHGRSVPSTLSQDV